jgi:putative SOS response-associated peptidase YedK|tara:strand:+ start:1335 stop:1913 length:579 start_codon:yes stop_codon:yes gene_type:complete
MCGRYTLTNKKEVKKKFEIDIEQNFNICPSSKVLVYTNKPEWMEWNYSPSWAKKPMNLINARYETIDEKPSFKDMNRCVFIMDGWYEWKRYFNWSKRENVKDPYYHHLNSDIIFVAGLYHGGRCVCVTKKSVKPISDIHNRQPLLLEQSQIEKWISGDYILRDNLSKNIQIHRVSTYVNSPKNNDANCVKPT